MDVSRRYNELADDKDLISSVGLVSLAKELGFKVSRRQAKALAKAKLVNGPRIECGTTANGNRLKFNAESAIDLIIYLLAESVSGLHGENSPMKTKILKYAKDCANEIDEKSLQVSAKLKGLAVAGYLVHSDIVGEKRLHQLQKVAKLVEASICVVWMLKNIFNSNDDYSIELLWRNAKNHAFNKYAVGKYAKDLVNEDGSCDNKSDSNGLNADFDSLTPEAKRALLCWVEILMVFRSGIIAIKSEAEAYMLDKYGVKIYLDTRASKLFDLRMKLI